MGAPTRIGRQPERVITVDDYLAAARIVARCRSERLPYVLELLCRAGIDLMKLDFPEVPDPVFGTDFRARLSAWLDEPIPDNWKSLSISEHLDWYVKPHRVAARDIGKRCAVSPIEVWREMLLQNGPLSRSTSKRINTEIGLIPGWTYNPKAMRCGPYGAQRGFVRTE